MIVIKSNGLRIFTFNPIAMFNAVPISNKIENVHIALKSFFFNNAGMEMYAMSEEIINITSVINMNYSSFESYNKEFCTVPVVCVVT